MRLYHRASVYVPVEQVFSLKLKNFPSQSLNPSHEIIKSSRGLLLPFVSWTLLYALLYHRGNIPNYLLGVIESPDRSLWFILVLFYCRMFFVLAHRLCAKLFTKFSAVSLFAVIFVIYAVIFSATKIFVPAGFLGLGLFCVHCPYFMLGVFAYQYRARLSGFLASITANVAMMILFMVIAPCWYLVSPNPFTASHGEFLFKIITRISPIPGIFLTLSAVKIIVSKNFMHLTSALCFIGKLTLGIYAIHGRFLGCFPPVIVPLSASIILTVIIGRIPVIRTLLLGNMLDYSYPTSRKEL